LKKFKKGPVNTGLFLFITESITPNYLDETKTINRKLTTRKNKSKNTNHPIHVSMAIPVSNEDEIVEES
jgi:hypothetical protein